MARKSPQEKKALSYAKDRRNNWCGGGQGVPVRKRLVNRANRKSIQQALSEAVGVPNPGQEEAAEQKALGKRPKSWRKSADIPLGEYLGYKHQVRKGHQLPDQD